MKKWIHLIFIVFISIVQSKAQSRPHFILAGQDTGLMYTKFSYPEWMFDVSHHSGGTFDIDINNNGVIDVQLQFVSSLNPALDGINYFSISPQYSGVQFSGSYDTVENDCGKQVFLITKSINQNDTISNESPTWLDTSAYSYYYNSLCSGSAVGTNQGYFGGRIIDHLDTSLFYLHIGLFGPTPENTSPSYRIFEYAIQGADTAISILTSINEVGTPERIKVYPNPFNDQINFTSNKPTEFKVCDYLGRTVMYGFANGKIETTEFDDGIYFLFIKQEGSYQPTKLLKY